MSKLELTSTMVHAQRLAEIDLLRFVAAASVAIYHWTYRPMAMTGPSETAFGAFQGLSKFGYLGVDLFFLISGFVILWTASNRGPTSFVISRLSRLYPTFWVCAAVTAVVLFAVGKVPEELTARAIALNFTMVPGALGLPYIDGVYWTLFVEVKFYFLVLLCLVFAPRNSLEPFVYLWLAGTTLAFAVALIGVDGLAVKLLDSFVLFPFSPTFIAGALCFIIWSGGATPLRSSALLLCLLLAVSNANHQVDAFVMHAERGDRVVAMAATAALFGLFGGIAFGLWRLPAWAIWGQLGALTYPLYLLHTVIGKVIWSGLPEVMGDISRLAIVASAVLVLVMVVTETSERRLAPATRRFLQALAPGHAKQAVR